MVQILVPLIIAGATAAIGAFFQNRQANTAEQTKRTDLEIAQAEILFNEISPMMDTRLFAMRRVYWILTSEDKDDEEVQTRWAAYQKILLDWNNNLNKHESLVEGYYGPAMYEEFNSQIQGNFRALHALIQGFHTQKEQPSDSACNEFSHVANELNEAIRQFNLKMIQAKQNWNVGVLRND